MNSLVSFLYALARAAAWGRAGARLAQGNPVPLARRIRNKAAFRLFGPFLRR